MEPDLSINIAGLRLRNPVLLASGTAGYGEEISEYVDLSKIGGIIVKGIAINPTPGNPPPRICETPSGMLNAIGLPNVGVDTFVKDKLPFLRKVGATVFVNIFGSTIDEYGEVAGYLNDVEGISALEVNISCPNIKRGGIVFGTDLKTTAKVVKKVRKATTLPIFVKLSPGVTYIRAFARVCEDEGADGLSLINTISAMSIDIETWKPRLANITGGLSGPAIRPIAIRMVWEVYNTVKIPIIGMGGIGRTEDAVEFFLAGASAVAVGTANFTNPSISMEIVEGLIRYLVARNLKRISSLTGALKV